MRESKESKMIPTFSDQEIRWRVVSFVGNKGSFGWRQSQKSEVFFRAYVKFEMLIRNLAGDVK